MLDANAVDRGDQSSRRATSMATDSCRKTVLSWMGNRLPELIPALGRQEFPAEILRALQKPLGASHLSVFAFDRNMVPSLVAAESIGGTRIAGKAGKIYEDKILYRHDPNIRRVRSGDTGNTQALVFRLNAADISDFEYRRRIYDRFGLVERLSVIDQIGGMWFVENFYRDARMGRFSEAQLGFLSEVAAVLAALVGKHLAMNPPPAWQSYRRPRIDLMERRLRGLDASLTERQIQVCARALMGMTNTGIALDLGVGKPTVATLRRRAYARLNITSLNELFAKCLSNEPNTQEQ